ncbi:AAA family ATPase [Candidatus Woesearchaeota archaeon]|nr:AAA family ATPase [Candidatus Woesearchaeota archaeon]
MSFYFTLTMGENDFEKEVQSFASRMTVLESENIILKQTISQLKNELDSVKTNPLMVCEVKDVLDKEVIIKVPNGNSFLVNVSSEMDLVPGDKVFVEQKNLNVIRKHHSFTDKDVEKFVIIEKPKTSWSEIGGLQKEIKEIKEVIELPLTKPEIFKKVGITPPKGVLLHGEPGTGKTLLAKAVAASTNATFIEIVGSELVQKFIGEGAKLVKDVFKMAKSKAPAILFIDEIDSIASQRIELGTSGEREVQRTFMQLLAEIDGFKNLDGVKIIGCTNRKDILDPAILRPGRLDRLIEVSAPDKDGIKEILDIHLKEMNVCTSVDLDVLAKKIEGISGAEIRALCTEAGYFALRDGRHKVVHEDFESSINKVMSDEDTGAENIFF